MNTRSSKGWKKFSFEEPTSPRKRSRKSPKPPKVEVAVIPKKDFNFEVKIEPKKVEELSIHNKKIEEVKSWLEFNVLDAKPKRNGAILLLTGPTGSGKTITVKVLSKSMNIDVSEWVNPIDNDFESFRSPGQTAQLLEFLTESKYPSLFSLNKPKVTLIEDYPNSVIHNPEEFIKILEKCYDGKSSVIFICTESSNSLNLSQKLFPQELQDKFSIANISFNACSATLLRQALKRAQKIIEDNADLFKSPNQDAVDGIIVSSMGDLRCAVHQFYFACLKDSTDLVPLTKTKAGTKRKRSDKNAPQIKSMMRDESLGLFHSLGRVLNPKRTNQGDSWRLQANVDALIDELSIQPATFSSFLHENYLKYFGDIQDVANASDVLSVAQIMLGRWTERQENLQYGLWLSVLGVMVNNEHRVSKWTQITGPKKFNKPVKDGINGLNIEDRSYFNLINQCTKYHSFN